jgi:uncharacterized membrane protein
MVPSSSILLYQTYSSSLLVPIPLIFHSSSLYSTLRIACRVMAKLEEASQFLYANAFASIGTVAAITLCLVLAATESMRRKKTEKKRVAVTPDTTAATAAATATTAAAVEVTASAAAAAAPVTIPAAVADSSE